MSRIKNYHDEQERVDSMDVAEAMFYESLTQHRVVKHKETKKKTIRPRSSYRANDYFAFDDQHGVFQVKQLHEMTEADWRWFEKG